VLTVLTVRALALTKDRFHQSQTIRIWPIHFLWRANAQNINNLNINLNNATATKNEIRVDSKDHIVLSLSDFPKYKTNRIIFV
jgi:hypothetical protein